MNGNLEEVKRNRGALNVKIRFVLEESRVSLTRISQRRKKEFESHQS